MEGSEETLARNAGTYYNQINQAELDNSTKSALLDVFVNWLEKRFKEMSKMEIEKMLLGELPDLRETQSGKDLIRIGKEEGSIETRQATLIRQLEAKFKSLTPEIRQRIQRLTSAEKLDNLLVQVLTIESVDEMRW